MAAINFGDLVSALGGVLIDAGFTVTPDQMVRANAVLMRLGTDRSPSGLVTVLAPVFCSSSTQQQEFATLFIRAMDLCSLAGDAPDPESRVLGREGKRRERDPAEVDREFRKARDSARARMPRIARQAAMIALAAVLALVFALVVLSRIEPPAPQSPSEMTPTEIQARKEQIPRTLPPIDGYSTVDIQIDTTGRAVITESLFQRFPLAGSLVIALVLTALGGIAIRRRIRRLPAPKVVSHPVHPQLRLPLRYGRNRSVAAANQLLLPSSDSFVSRIDVAASIRRHVRLGYWKGLVHAQPIAPDYVVVTRRKSPTDARAIVTESMIAELVSLGVSIETFTTCEESGLCVCRDGGKPIRLSDLARERADDRLLLFSDGSDLTDPATNRVFPWVSAFGAWKWRRLVVPKFSLSGVDTAELDRLFNRTEATMAGLAQIGLPKESETTNSGAFPLDWSRLESAEKLANRLAEWLGPSAFQWLAACAIYSSFNGALMLYLGEMPELAGLTETDLERILSLPYVIEEVIPEALRLELIDRLDPEVAKATRNRIVELLKSGPPRDSAESESFKIEYAAQKWLASREPVDRAHFVDAVKSATQDPFAKGSALYALTERILPFWTRRRWRQIGNWGVAACVAVLVAVPFIPLLPAQGKAGHMAAKPLGTNFGDWICFTKIEQSIDWHLAPGTEIKKLSIVGYDQSAAGEGFQLVSRANPGETVGPIDRIEGGQAGNASLVFEPLHAKEYTGQLNIDTNHGRVVFNLRGTGVYGGDSCIDEGHGDFGLESDFNGNGCNTITQKNGTVTALLAPARATNPSETHSALVLGPWRQGDFDLQCGVRTIAQLRDPAPNAWEVGWLIWNFVDLKHFYYLALKSNGWELGRKDNLDRTGQRFLATKEFPTFPPGRRYLIHIVRRGDSLSVDVNGDHLVSIVDKDHPADSGRIGFYSECAATQFDSLAIK